MPRPASPCSAVAPSRLPALGAVASLCAPAQASAGAAAEWPLAALVTVTLLATVLAGTVLLCQQLCRERRRHQQRAAHKSAQAEVLCESLQRFEGFANATDCGFGMAELDGTITYVNPALTRMIGEAQPEDAVGRRIADYYPPELHDKLFNEVLPTVMRTGHWSGEMRLRGRDGSLLDVEENYFFVRDEEGTPRLLANILTDIRARKSTEAQLRLMASVFEHSGEAILITDASNAIITANRAFTALTGYSLDEVRGRNPRILSAGLTSESVYRHMWRSIDSSGYWQGEIWDRRKDGAIYPKWLSISTIRNAAGETTHHIASFTDITERKQIEERIQHLAHHDPLTGLPNRLQLEGRIRQALADARRDGDALAVVFADLDNFKFINDSLGHHIGDRLLISVAERLRAAVRDSDIVARLGGDEFIIVLTRLDDAQVAIALCEKIRQHVGERFDIDGHALHTTLSLGVSLYPLDGRDADTLMRAADAAMYHAKGEGRNNIQLFDSRLNEAAAMRVRTETRLRAALEHGHFLLHYQPQFTTIGEHVVGVEALLRWQPPDEEMVPPDQFIPLAEDTGLIVPIGAWVIDEALAQLARWRSAGIDGLRMSINLSAHQLRLRELPRLIGRSIEQHGLQPADLELEVTESVAMRDPESTIGILTQLRDMGIALAIDDFGTGYSSLSYLKLLPISRLKLDRSFVHDIESNPNDAAISAATISLAHTLGLEVVAEGVEGPAQLGMLTQLGCDLLQGYHFSRPLAAPALADFVRDWRASH